MQQYIARRLFFGVIVLGIVGAFIFVLVRLLPGDAVYSLLGEEASSPKVIAAVRSQLGLDKPIHEQFIVWVGGVLRGDLGRSLRTGEPVVERMLRRLPVTFELVVLAMVFGTVIAIPIGVLSAIRQDSTLDYVLRVTSITLLAMPAFWIGTMLLVFPSIWFQWVPPLGFTNFWQNPGDNLVQVAFPVFVLATHLSVSMMRMMRSALLEVLRQDYIRTAWSKGLKETMVIARHALKNALIPVVTLAGLSFGRLLGGTVILESIFSIPGVGRLFLEAVTNRDYTQVQAIILFYALVFLVMNLIVDTMYAWLDPRIKYQ